MGLTFPRVTGSIKELTVDYNGISQAEQAPRYPILYESFQKVEAIAATERKWPLIPLRPQLKDPIQ